MNTTTKTDRIQFASLDAKTPSQRRREAAAKADAEPPAK
jgi:hypothetical protein